MSGIIGDNTGDHSGQIATVQGITTSSSDPAIDTDPSGGIGTVWANTTSGEMYACTDATAGANVWTNVGDGTGDIEPWYFGGTNYGYSYGGTSNSNINQFSLTSDGKIKKTVYESTNLDTVLQKTHTKAQSAETIATGSELKKYRKNLFKELFVRSGYELDYVYDWNDPAL